MRVLAIVVAAALFATLSGCAATIMRNPVPVEFSQELAPVPGLGAIRSWGDEVPTDLRAEFQRHLPNVKEIARDARVIKGRKQFDILALSGGGPDGAFGAGVLTGWTARGDRPEFQLVTGVSAGAIIAPFAFLGPDHDATLKEVWTQYDTKQLVTAQFLPGLLGGPSLADTAPLRELIAKYVDRAFLRNIAAEYRRGRLLTIGTTNLDAKRPVVWNMGEIAIHDSAEAVELFRDVILASAAIPGLFPPVNIKVKAPDGKYYEELHVDGGVTRQVYVAPVNLPFEAFNQLFDKVPDRRLFLIQNGRLAAEYEPVDEKTIPIAAKSISTLLTSQNKGDIYRIYRMSRDAGVGFNMLAVPDDFSVRPQQAFDPAYQTALFEAGAAMGRDGRAWLREPPYLRKAPTRVLAARPSPARAAASTARDPAVAGTGVTGP